MGLLRVFLALSVVTAHVGPIIGINFVDGQTAVQSFFIISGFYMSLILNEKYLKTPNPYRLFITNRFLRIFPTYWFIFLIILALNMYWHSIGMSNQLGVYKEYIHIFNPFSFIYLLLSNLFILGQDISFFLGINNETGNLFFTSNYLYNTPTFFSFMMITQAWSLGIELMFYIIAPFIVSRNYKVIIFLMILSLLLRIALYMLGLHHDPWAYRFFPTELFFFLAGSISYKIYKKIESKKLNTTHFFVITITVFLLTIFFKYIPSKTIFYFASTQWLYYLIIVLSIPVIFLNTKHNKLDTFIGNFSYPIYLSHLLIAHIFINYNIGRFNNNQFFSLFVAFGSILFSYIIVKFIDAPINIFRRGRVNAKN